MMAFSLSLTPPVFVPVEFGLSYVAADKRIGRTTTAAPQHEQNFRAAACHTPHGNGVGDKLKAGHINQVARVSPQDPAERHFDQGAPDDGPTVRRSDHLRG